MTIGIDAFMQGFTPEERAKVAARSAELIAEELTGRRLGLGRTGARCGPPATNPHTNCIGDQKRRTLPS